MASQQRLHESLPNPAVVAYLLPHVEWLSGEDVFKAQLALYIVLEHLCHYPQPARVPHPDARSAWSCPVAEPHHKPKEIAKATPLDEKTVRDAIDQLEALGIISVDRGDGKGKYKKYGPITIMSTNRSTDYDARIRRHQYWDHERAEWVLPSKIGSRTQMSTVPPAKRRSAQISGESPNYPDPAEPPRPRRTVAATRLTRANAGDPEGPATIKPEPPGRRPVEDARSEVAAPEGCGHMEAGHSDDAIDSSITKSSSTGASSPRHSRSPVARTSGRKPAERDSARVRAWHGDQLPDVVLPAIAADGLVTSPGYRAGDDRAARDRFALYYDTGDRQHRPVVVP
jgi:hypothetical protein